MSLIISPPSTWSGRSPINSRTRGDTHLAWPSTRLSAIGRPLRSGSCSKSAYSKGEMGAGFHGVSVQFTHRDRELDAVPFGLVPPHPFYPPRLIIEYFWMSRYICLDTIDNLWFTLVKYHGSDNVQKLTLDGCGACQRKLRHESICEYVGMSICHKMSYPVILEQSCRIYLPVQERQ